MPAIRPQTSLPDLRPTRTIRKTYFVTYDFGQPPPNHQRPESEHSPRFPSRPIISVLHPGNPGGLPPFKMGRSLCRMLKAASTAPRIAQANIPKPRPSMPPTPRTTSLAVAKVPPDVDVTPGPAKPYLRFSTCFFTPFFVRSSSGASIALALQACCGHRDAGSVWQRHKPGAE